MKAGKLQHRVQVQAPPGAESPQNEFGEPSGDWETVATRWASIEPLSGSESVTADQTQSPATHRITLRRFALTPRHRVKWGTRYFYVTAAQNPEELSEQVTANATERV